MIGGTRTPVASLIAAGSLLFAHSLGTGRLETAAKSPDYSALDAPRFEVDYHRGRLTIDGHTLSSDHEQALMEAATRLSTTSATHVNFQPLGVVPDFWMSSTLSLLHALDATRSANAVLRKNRLEIRGIAADGWPARLEALQSALPEALELVIDVAIPDAAISVASICARALSGHKAGAVNFKGTGTVFRSSAYGVLDRVIALADACRDSTVVITGHTDSTGPELFNQYLSLARATAVADYIAQRGITRDRLIVAGAGSSLPVADNHSRYGRGLNRRIDIYLRPGR